MAGDAGDAGDDDDADEGMGSDGDADPVHKMSIDDDMPTGGIFTQVQQIRKTVNKYCNALSIADWYMTVKVPTVRAAERRLLKYEQQVVSGSQVEVQIAFKQLCARIRAVLGLHKTLKVWGDSQQVERLAACAKYFRVLARYFDAVKGSFAPDLGILKVQAEFQADIRGGMPLDKVMAKIDLDYLATCRAEVSKLPAPPSSSAQDGTPVKTEGTDTQDSANSVSASAGSAKKPRRKS